MTSIKWWLGSERKKAALANEVPEGAYIQEVVQDSPAEKAGIKAEDIIVKIDGMAVKEIEGGLAKVIAQKRAGDKIEVEYWRDGEMKKVKVELGKME